MEPVPINIAVEDNLSEAVAKKILEECQGRYAVGFCYGKSGVGYLRKNIGGFNNAAKGTPYLIMTDLDEASCPPELADDWLKSTKHPNLMFWVAVREVEAWILADRMGFSRFLGIRKALIPESVEDISSPKEFLISLARRSSKPSIRKDIVPRDQSSAKIGPDYNGRLVSFVLSTWDIQAASSVSASLRRAVDRAGAFRQVWPSESRRA